MSGAPGMCICCNSFLVQKCFEPVFFNFFQTSYFFRINDGRDRHAWCTRGFALATKPSADLVCSAGSAWWTQIPSCCWARSLSAAIMVGSHQEQVMTKKSMFIFVSRPSSDSLNNAFQSLNIRKILCIFILKMCSACKVWWQLLNSRSLELSSRTLTSKRFFLEKLSAILTIIAGLDNYFVHIIKYATDLII